MRALTCWTVGLLLTAVAGATPREEKTTHEVFSFGRPDAPRRVVVDNFEGPVTIVGEERSDVALTLREVVAADSAELLATARREVRLERSSQGNVVRLFADGPFRSRDGGICFHGWERLGYRVTYALELRVPRDVDLVARTTNEGDVLVRGVHGELQVENVNGGVRAESVAGAGAFGTVNGDLRVTFASNPTGASRFHNVNGVVDVSFQHGFAADLSLKTMNGQVWSDFPYEYRALPVEAGRRDGARFVYRSHGATGIRVGAGGPQLGFETLNGDIHIRQSTGG